MEKSIVPSLQSITHSSSNSLTLFVVLDLFHFVVPEHSRLLSLLVRTRIVNESNRIDIDKSNEY